jgi:uncharacterized protein YdhG (YjbR/CyaY superfamily)
MKNFKNVDEYIQNFPAEVQILLEKVRQTIKDSAPDATEVISYSMPGYKLNGMLVWFAGYSKHIGFYPGANGISSFKKEISSYKSAKGSVQFPLNQPLPLDLISRITKFRMIENLALAKSKSHAK